MSDEEWRERVRRLTPAQAINTASQVLAPIIPLLGPYGAIVSAAFGIGGALAGLGDRWQKGARLVHNVIELWRREDETGQDLMHAAWEARMAKSLADYRVSAVKTWEQQHTPAPSVPDTELTQFYPDDEEIDLGR